MTNIVEIADHMVNLVEDYAELMGVSVVVEAEFKGNAAIFTAYITKE